MANGEATARSDLEPVGRVLVVDDSDDFRHLVTYLLEREGYEVISADSGPAAIEAVRASEVNVVLLDVMMPMMGGFAVCHELKQSSQTADLPVILITAKDDMETRATGMKLGVSEFLAKPVNHKELLRRVRTQLEARARAGKLDRARKLAESIHARGDRDRPDPQRHTLRSPPSAADNPLSSSPARAQKGEVTGARAMGAIGA